MSLRHSFLLTCLALALLGLACIPSSPPSTGNEVSDAESGPATGESAAGMVGASTVDAGSGCVSEQQLCGEVCVDVWTDPRHCGACGHACAPGEVCKAQRCSFVEDCRQTGCTGLTWCDPANGYCKQGCDKDAQCSNGMHCNVQTHACECPVGQHPCAGHCVSNTSVDTCGNSCTPCPGAPNAEGVCAQEQCALRCLPGYHLCNGRCVSDNATSSCGSSCTPCQPPANGIATCNAGQCDFDCVGGTLKCGGVCALCPAQSASQFACEGTRCVASACVGDARVCDGACASCPTTGVTSTQCEGGRCVAATCATGSLLCDGACAACPQSEGISSYVCRAGQCGTVCMAGYSPCATGCCPWNVQLLEPSGSTKFGDRVASVADAAGNVHVAYLQTFYSGTTALLRYIAWNRARGAWDAPTSTTAGGSVDIETPAIAVQNGVTVAVAFGRTFQSTSGTWSQRVYFAQSSTGWRDELVSSAQAQNTPRPSLVENNGEFHVAYLVPHSTYALDGTGYWRRRVQGVWQTAEAFSTRTPLPTADTSSLGATGLFVDSLGGVNAFYSPYSNSPVQWSRRAPGSMPSWSARGTTAPPGKWSSAKKGDAPAILWVSSYGNMRYSTWSNDQWVDEEVPNTSIAFSPSLAIDALGQPHISYNNTALRQLLYLTKRAGIWVSTVVDTGLDVNDPCSLTLVDGKPHIAYQRGYSLKGAYLP